MVWWHPNYSQLFIEFSLESIQALLSNLPDGVVLSSRSHSFVWRTLCPTLLKLVGVPCPNAPATTDCRISDLRSVASIGCELLRLFGNVSVLRAPLESLFHRLLVTDHIATRIEIFKTIKEVNRLLLDVIRHLKSISLLGLFKISPVVSHWWTVSHRSKQSRNVSWAQWIRHSPSVRCLEFTLLSNDLLSSLQCLFSFPDYLMEWRKACKLKMSS